MRLPVRIGADLIITAGVVDVLEVLLVADDRDAHVTAGQVAQLLRAEPARVRQILRELIDVDWVGCHRPRSVRLTPPGRKGAEEVLEAPRAAYPREFAEMMPDDANLSAGAPPARVDLGEAAPFQTKPPRIIGGVVRTSALAINVLEALQEADKLGTEVLAFHVARVAGARWGSATVSKQLDELRGIGWLSVRAEPGAAGQPERRWYRLTPTGQAGLRAVLCTDLNLIDGYEPLQLPPRKLLSSNPLISR
jgi:DNA-binding PadR family transcriptional regulator